MPQAKDHYISIRKKFYISISVALLYLIFAVWISQNWFIDLSSHVGIFLAGFLVLFIAILPGFFNVFMFVSLALDKRPQRKHLKTYPPISILVAAYNEEKNIAKTIVAIGKQNYPGEIEVIVINDGSKDRTKEVVTKLKNKFSWLKLIDVKKNQGKALCLNQALKSAEHNLIITIDGDSFLFKDALSRIVERYKCDPKNTKAVAGAVMVGNSRDNWITKSQEYDYFHGIACVKRVQSLYQETLVAQGSFSLYTKGALKEVGGWPNMVGEDIVMTWALLEKNYRIGYAEDAVVFTQVPTTLRGFFNQRKRWGRGMLEALKCHPKLLFQRKINAFFIWVDFFFPFIDFAFTFGFIPGLIAACFGYYWIVGLITLSLIPLSFLLNWGMHSIETKMYQSQDLKVRRNRIGFLIYSIFYTAFMHPITLAGYFYELLGAKKLWGSK